MLHLGHTALDVSLDLLESGIGLLEQARALLGGRTYRYRKAHLDGVGARAYRELLRIA